MYLLYSTSKEIVVKRILTRNLKQLGINIFILSMLGIILSVTSFFINNYINNNHYTFNNLMQYNTRFGQKGDLVNITFEERGEVPVDLLRQAYQYFLVLKACADQCDNTDTIQSSVLLEINNFNEYLNKTSDLATITKKVNENIAHRSQTIKTAEFWQNLISLINFFLQAISASFAFATVIIAIKTTPSSTKQIN